MYSYTIKKTEDYEVTLKPNDFYTSEVLPSDNYYPSKAVDNYAINFGYDFKSNEELNFEYNYNVTAEMIGIVKSSDDKGNEIWTRTFDILENKTGNGYQDNFLINEKVDIDYEYYNNLARSYEETYGILIDSNLKVRFNIISKVNDETIDDYIELDIKLNDTVTNAEKNYQEVRSNVSIQDSGNISKTQIISYLFGGLFFISIIFFIIVKFKNKKDPKKRYKNNVKHIIKYYRDLIVIAENKPDLKDLKIIKISSLDSLVNVAEQTNNTIIYYEIIKDKVSNLYVIVDEYVYVYTVTVTS